MIDLRTSVALLLAAGLLACSAESAGTGAILLPSDGASGADATQGGDAPGAGTTDADDAGDAAAQADGTSCDDVDACTIGEVCAGSVYSLDLTTGKATALSGFVVPKASWWGAGVSTEAGL